ncbi:hypothetical protein HK098_003163 [Nowakowskiella sp. JEL0407]|nr:hypothetical protein HK098_003163 [Nowakowskiella sp. JEL0407]
MSSHWKVDFAPLEKSSSKVAEPVGFVSHNYKSLTSKTPQLLESTENQNHLKMKKAWEVVLGSARSIPMNAFMLYMSGNGVQIWSILVTVMLLWNSLKAIAGVQSAFERFATTPTRITGLSSLLQDPLLPVKLGYIGVNLLNFFLGVYKCSAMGLLPVESDWMQFLEEKIVLENSFGL